MPLRLNTTQYSDQGAGSPICRMPGGRGTKGLALCLADLDQTSIMDFMELSVRTHVIHAKRRLHEVQDAQTQLQNAGIEPLVSKGVQSLFERTSQALDAAPTSARSVEESLTWLSRHARARLDIYV